MEAATVRATFLPALELLPNLGLIATLAYGGHQVIEGNLSIGDLVAFNLYVAMLVWPLRMLGMILRSEEHTSELQSLMRISYAVFCLKKKTTLTHDPRTIIY